jgi:hypothetical protein
MSVCTFVLGMNKTDRLLIPLDFDTNVSVEVVDRNNPDPLQVPPNSFTSLLISFSADDDNSHIPRIIGIYNAIDGEPLCMQLGLVV